MRRMITTIVNAELLDSAVSYSHEHGDKYISGAEWLQTADASMGQDEREEYGNEHAEPERPIGELETTGEAVIATAYEQLDDENKCEEHEATRHGSLVNRRVGWDEAGVHVMAAHEYPEIDANESRSKQAAPEYVSELCIGCGV